MGKGISALVGGGIAGLIVFVIVMVIFAPIFSIWAVNLLFGTQIPVTFWTWLSALWITHIVHGSSSSSS
ncbi:hypothetical protein CMI47_11170 [Candidatus Pacearchaeota archaeon]|nr:hypothetical protein [Candidatus Pacearchaeota archaeon]